MDEAPDDIVADSALHAELTTAGASLRRRAADLADTDGVLLAIRGETLVRRDAPADLTSRRRRRLRAGVGLVAAAALVAVVLTQRHPAPGTSSVLQLTSSPTSLPTPTPSAVTITSIAPSPAPTATGNTYPTVRSCTYTDPAMRASSVSRVLTCPDGTRVFVYGVVVQDAAGRDWLCDQTDSSPVDPLVTARQPVSGSDVQPCPAAGLLLVDSPRAIGGGYVGTKQGESLVNGPSTQDGTPMSTVVPTTVPFTGPNFPPTT